MTNRHTFRGSDWYSSARNRRGKALDVRPGEAADMGLDFDFAGKASIHCVVFWQHISCVWGNHRQNRLKGLTWRGFSANFCLSRRSL